MCGIACILSNDAWTREPSLGWAEAVLADLEQVESEPAEAPRVAAALEPLAERFTELMCFGTHMALIEQARTHTLFEKLASVIRRLEKQYTERMSTSAAGTEQVVEKLRDYGWQIETELLGNVRRTLALLPEEGDPSSVARAQHFTAWSIEQVLESLDRLEVRGRDSAGIAVLLVVDPSWDPAALPPPLRQDLERRTARIHAEDGSVAGCRLPDGRLVYRFIYKVANLIGWLGDNGKHLRAAIRSDALLWHLARHVRTLNAMAHTRWASNGIINLPNCHPANGSLAADDAELPPDADTAFVLNGDVDNNQELLATAVLPRDCALPEGITTDAKTIPILFRLDGDAQQPVADRFLETVRRLEGSMAIALQYLGEPDRLYLAQKGSGQSLFTTEVTDGWLVASEVYGLAPRARNSTALVQTSRGGIQVTLASTVTGAAQARLIADGEVLSLQGDPIEIFSRDIFRGDYEYFFDKEIHEAPSSVRKTLAGRYATSGRRVRFDTTASGSWKALRGRLEAPTMPTIRRIIVTGQGTAAIAAMGVAHLIEQALRGTNILVSSQRSSELSVSLGTRAFDDLLVVAISQSGTTTDTNRTADLARASGAWVHAIVNRRNSPLVRKANSHLFTSDGRDIEMAVASTKAFYSQIAAGKLTALFLADRLGTMTPAEIYDETAALEALPERIQEVFADEAAIARCAQDYAPFCRYWAVVGNGPNKIAAEEIRIKISELCYKSTPCDFTEDKKHIDLSTEPLTLVVANDLPGSIVQDTAKEVGIFKAHNGRPMVLAARGESSFDAVAEAVIHLPSAGAGLDFVLATVAGHLWAFYAAKKIDRLGGQFRDLLGAFTVALEAPERADLQNLRARLAAVLDQIASGEMNAALPAGLAAQIARYLRRLDRLTKEAASAALLESGIAVMRKAYEETSRSIDTIRHQAKTVTVGTSRPHSVISPQLTAALGELGVTNGWLAGHDQHVLETLSPVVAGVEGGVLYRIVAGRESETSGEIRMLEAIKKIGRSEDRASHYDRPLAVRGSKRRALRLNRATFSTGKESRENLLIVPVFKKRELASSGLVLFHLALVPQASLQQKTSLLRGLGLYEDIFDSFHETAPTMSFAAFIERQTPRDLLFEAPAVA
ncbi:MAG: SIS domain-containing protein [bacterium]|nr:SIS domain-containing protein [bacterium]